MSEVVTTLDYHTAGEPLRIVTGGLPPLPGDTMLAKRQAMAALHDDWRKRLMGEPRGHADMYGAVLTEPVTEDGDCGVLFLHNAGYSTMCGHGIIALATAALEQGVFSYADASRIRFDTPAGRVTAAVETAPAGGLQVRFENVPSFAAGRVEADLPGLGTVAGELAFGGAWYVYVDAAAAGIDLLAPDAAHIVRQGRALKQAFAPVVDLRHPDRDRPDREALEFLYGIVFTGRGAGAGATRHGCVFADGELDRSPTGTAVSGRAAIERAADRLGLHTPLTVESVIGTRFSVRCLADERCFGVDTVRTEVTGSAHRIGESRFVLSPHDPLPEGFLLP